MHIVPWIIIGLAASVGTLLGRDSASSGAGMTMLLLLPMLAAPLILVTAWFYIREQKFKLLQVGRFVFLLGGILAISYALQWYALQPPKYIRYSFAYGQTGSWHEVQFLVFHHGHWINGPWVGGGPVSVRFPDLNGDGLPDIKVIGHVRGGSGMAEFIYLPEGKGQHAFHMTRRDELLVNYIPDNIQ